MRLERKVAALWLRIPERGIDVLAILFSGAGINIMTGAPSSANPGSVLLSGFAITATGVVMTLLKYQNGLIRSTVESRIQADADVAEGFLMKGGKSTVPQLKSLSEHLDEVISDFMDGSPNATAFSRNVIVATLLAIVGLAAAYGPVFTPKRSKESEIIEKLQTIENTITTLGNDDARLAELLETRCKAVQTQLKELELRVTEIQDKAGRIIERPVSPR